MRIPNTRASWIDPAPTSTSSHASAAGAPRAVRRRAQAPSGGVGRATIAVASTPGGSVPVGEAALAAQARGAERVGDGGRRVADEQRGLQREREALDDAAGAVLEGVGVAQLAAHPRGVRVEARVRAGGLVHLVEEGVERMRRAADRAQRVERQRCPERSRIEPSGASRYRRGIPDAST
jgi:hypothetical protein